MPIDQAPIPNGGIVVNQGRIVAVGTKDALLALQPHAPREHYPDHVLLPGLVNAHLQLDLAQFTCPPASDAALNSGNSPHTAWLAQAMQFRQKKSLEVAADASRHAFGCLKQYGVTCIGAMTNYDGTTELIEESGLRAVVYLELFGSNPAMQTQDRFESALAIIEQHQDKDAKVQMGFGPLAPYLLSRDFLKIISRHAKLNTLPIQIQAAVSMDEMEFFFNSSGPIGSDIFPILGWGAASGLDLPPAFQKTPVHYLEDIGFLASSPTLIGCVQLAGKDISILKKHGCHVVYSPSAVATFHLGEFPFGKLHEQHVPVALGTLPLFDAVDGNLWEEMRAALRTGGIEAEHILAMATLHSAESLGLGELIGSLTPGKWADYILVEQPADCASLASALITNTSSQHIIQTVVAGEPLYHVHIDA